MKVDLYGETPPNKLPAYSAPDAALYLSLAASTVRWWSFGRTSEDGKDYSPMIKVADLGNRLLSFENLIELHVLSSIRGKGIPLQALRSALEYLRREFKSDHPLATEEMFTAGGRLLVERLGVHIETSTNQGQVAMGEMIKAHLERVTKEAHVPVRIYPFISRKHDDENKPVMIDPRIEYGRPCLAGTGIPTASLVERWRGGETIQSIARDFDLPEQRIEEAIKYATSRARAA